MSGRNTPVRRRRTFAELDGIEFEEPGQQWQNRIDTPTVANLIELDPPSAPHTPINRRSFSRTSRASMRTLMGKTKLQKELLKGDRKITPAHIVRYLIFGDRKKAMCTIRKEVLRHTLEGANVRVSKSAKLQVLLEEVSRLFGYESLKQRTLASIVAVQKRFRKYVSDKSTRIMGPGFPVTRCVNHDCPFTLEPLSEIPNESIMTWRDPYRGIPAKYYGCDVDMLIQSIRRELTPIVRRRIQENTRDPGEYIPGTKNPFTRGHLTIDLLQRCNQYTKLKGQRPLFTDEPCRVNSVSTPRRRREFRPSELEFIVGRARRNRRRVHGGLSARGRQLDYDDEDDFANARNVDRVIDNDDDDDASTVENITAASPVPLTPVAPQRIRSLRNIRDIVLIERTALVEDILSLRTLAMETSETLRDLGFYTSETLLWEPLRICEALLQRTSASVILTRVVEARRFYRDRIMPMVRAISMGFSLQTVRDITRHIRTNLGREPYQQLNRILSAIRRGGMGTAAYHTLQAITIANPSNSPEICERLQKTIAETIRWIMFQIITVCRYILVDGESIIPEEDRRSFVIIVIGAFVEGGFLGEEFEWARLIGD